MKLSDVLTPSFRLSGRELDLKVEVFEGRLVVIAPLWRRALSTESLFCRAVVSAGYLTEEQMQHAARRYRLGRTRQGGVIFWQIDADGDICDGKVMYYCEDCHRDKQRHPTWVSTLLQRRYRWADAERMTTRHCFFGLHLLGSEKCRVKSEKFATAVHTKQNSCNSFNSWLKNNIAVVESEKSAVILSEHFPQHVWLATGGLGNVQADKFRPLRGHRVTLFPDTDPDGKTFKAWYDAAQLVMQQPFWEDSPPITVSPLLELHATEEQKRRKIDLVDYLFEK